MSGERCFTTFYQNLLLPSYSLLSLLTKSISNALRKVMFCYGLTVQATLHANATDSLLSSMVTILDAKICFKR